jgi:ribonuclease P protein component
MTEPAPPPLRFGFPRQMRVRRRTEFRRVLQHGQRLADARLQVWAFPNGLDCPRLGLIVGRKHGTAVRRNRLKRQLREAFRLSQHGLPAGIDFICAPRVGVTLTREHAMQSLTTLAQRLAGKLERA